MCSVCSSTERLKVCGVCGEYEPEDSILGVLV